MNAVTPDHAPVVYPCTVTHTNVTAFTIPQLLNSMREGFGMPNPTPDAIIIAEVKAFLHPEQVAEVNNMQPLQAIRYMASWVQGRVLAAPARSPVTRVQIKREPSSAGAPVPVPVPPAPPAVPAPRGPLLGNSCIRRHKRVMRNNIYGITKGDIRRLARRGGIERINGNIYEEVRGVLKIWLEPIIRDASSYAEHGRRKTVIAMDVVYALKRQGVTLYGFGG